VVAAGVKARLNFSPGALKAPSGMKLKNVDPPGRSESLRSFIWRD
jgi:NADH/NAD ratio-sensing transcriptional regulator Rex